MKKILCCLICCVCAGCAQINTLSTSAKKFLNRNQIELEKINNQIETEIDKAYSGEYGNFIINLNKSISTPEEVWENMASTMLEGLLEEVKDESKKDIIKQQSIIRPYPKTNMLANALIYQDLETAEEALLTAKENLFRKNGLCNNTDSSDFTWKISNRKSSQSSWFCEQNPEYQKLLERLKNIEKVKGEIYSYSYSYEKNKFQKATGFDITNVQLLISTLLNVMPATPAKQTLYSLEDIEVKQNVNGGILVGGNDMMLMYGDGIYANKMAFIYTNKQYVEGRQLSGLVKHVGTYTYRSVLGAKKTIDSYKFFTFNWKAYNLKEKDFHFYPSFNLSKEDVDIEKFFLEEVFQIPNKK